MQKLNAVVIDDEVGGRETLAALLVEIESIVEVVGTANGVATGRTLIEEKEPDLVFLDIEMNDGTGFDLLNYWEKLPFEVVFVTAYNEYALKAFEVAALDYLLKPVNIEKLKRAVSRAESKIDSDDDSLQEKIQVFQENYAKPHSQENKLALPTLNGYSFVPIKDIIFCKADDAYTELYLTNKRKEVVSMKLIRIEEMLAGYRFSRIHRSYFINLNHVVRYLKGRGGEVEMSDGSNIDVARRKKEEFLKAISM